MTARDLLTRAAERYDDPAGPLRPAAARAALGGFAAGAGWMGLALGIIRGTPCPAAPVNFRRLGRVKYALALAAAVAWGLASFALGAPGLALFAAVVFYAVEAQMVFLFPVALDGSARPFRDARLLTVRAGGTFAVMRVVIPLACTMLLGGFARRGFVRSWCLGCLAVCLWYEHLCRPVPPGSRLPGPEADGGRGFPLEIGCFRPLSVRHEPVRLGLSRPVRILYASDLHLGHGWTRGVPAQLGRVARETAPDLVLLGGDLADAPGALPLLRGCVRRLTEIAPVYAVPGNHDVLAGLAGVRAAVRAAGGFWLPDRPAYGPLDIEGTIHPATGSRPRLLCAHYPGVFPAAARAGYDLVLAGHLHGGQCVFGTRRGRLYPGAWFCRWHGLRFVEGGSVMIVSRGVADTLPVRFNCPREVILCEVT